MLSTVGTEVNGLPMPPLLIDEEQYEQLEALARAALRRVPEVAHVLLEEIERAQILPSDHIPPTVIKVGSEVGFRDELSGKIKVVRLVFPVDADISKNCISVLTPIGVALIGLCEGDVFTWKTVSGEVRRLTILVVVGN